MSSPIEKQYISPNCVLSLQGFSEETGEQNTPIMTVLTQAKCQIIGYNQSLEGGLSFLEHLLQATSKYTQGLLSGLTHPWESNEENDYISLQKLPGKNRHLLIWQKVKGQIDDQLEVELSTIQLFDLLDAIDQFYSDEYTLPSLQDELKPLSRRYRQSEVSVVEQSTPATLGLISFAAAAVLMFMLPNPGKIEDPNLESQATPIETEVIPQEGQEP